MKELLDLLIFVIFVALIVAVVSDKGCCVTIDGQEHCLSLHGGDE